MKRDIKRRTSLRVTLAIVYTAIGTVILVFRQDIAILLFHDASRISWILGFSIPFLLFGIGALLYLYLRGDINFPFMTRIIDVDPFPKGYDASNDAQILELQSRLAELNTEIRKQSVISGQLSSGQLAALVTDLKQQLQGVVASDIVKTIEQKYSPKIAEDAQIAQLRRGIDMSKSRLDTEVKSLSRRNSLNLAIGAVTTGLAVAMLAYLVLGGPQYKFFNKSKATPFVRALFGGSNNRNEVTNALATATDKYTKFAMAVGGGLDLRVSKHVDLRLFQIEWVPVFAKDRRVVATDGTIFDIRGSRRNDWRFAVGVVFK